MSETRKFTPQQLALVKEFEVYGIDETDIIFYSEKPEPFFTYEATALLCRKLTDVKEIDLEELKAFPEATAFRCRLVFEDGTKAAAPGIVNSGESIGDTLMSSHQRIALASARAIRNALKASGINLLKAHQQAKLTGEVSLSGEDKLRNSLLAEVHALGEETGFIVNLGNRVDKTAWRNVILKRYGGHSSALLTIENLTDFAAFLRSCLQKAA